MFSDFDCYWRNNPRNNQGQPGFHQHKFKGFPFPSAICRNGYK